jgi:hypothetical protein
VAPPRPVPRDVGIRDAVFEDVAALRDFRCAVPGEPWTIAPEILVTSSVPHWIGLPDVLILVAETSVRIVGVIAVHLDPLERGAWVSEVLAVVPDRRREYIGFNLKRAALQRVVSLGGSVVTSEVDEHNIAMRRCNDCFDAASAPSRDEPEFLLTAVRVGHGKTPGAEISAPDS